MPLIWMAALLALGSHRSATPPPGAAGPAAPVVAPSPGELRRTVDAYLGSIDTPIAPSRWRALGPAAAPLLEQVLDDAQAFPTRRARALEGLAWAAPERAAPRLAALSQREEEPIVVRVAAMQGAARLLPSPELAAALLPVVRSAREPGLRAAAAGLLARSAHPPCKALRAQAALEEPGAFERALLRCR